MGVILDELLTPKEVAEYCRVSERTVRRWCDDGILEWCYLGQSRIRRIRAESVARLPRWI